jgi:hypothetical protein
VRIMIQGMFGVSLSIQTYTWRCVWVETPDDEIAFGPERPPLVSGVSRITDNVER